MQVTRRKMTNNRVTNHNLWLLIDQLAYKCKFFSSAIAELSRSSQAITITW